MKDTNKNTNKLTVSDSQPVPAVFLKLGSFKISSRK
jgi:hypothetical protein